MSRPLRLELPDALYHVSARGNAGCPIFLNDGDREVFLTLLGREVEQHRWICHGFCLLTHEYRLLIETPEANLGRGIGRLNAVYSQWFNRHYRRSGHLLQGRYKAIIVEKPLFLLPLARELAWAPVAAGLAKRPGQWRWSSHRAIGKGRNPPSWLTANEILDAFADAAEGRRKAYRAFVQSGKAEPAVLDQVQAQIYLGSGSFRAALAGRAGGVSGGQGRQTRPRADRPTATAIVALVADAAGVASSTVLDRRQRQDVFQVAVYLLRRAADLSLKEVAALASVSPPRVSQIQRAIDDAGGLAQAHGWAEPLARRCLSEPAARQRA